MLLQEEQGCHRAHLSQQEASQGWDKGVNCSTFHIRVTDSQSKDSMQLEFGKHGNMVLDRDLAVL